jgi:hypothetical protein
MCERPYDAGMLVGLSVPLNRTRLFIALLVRVSIGVVFIGAALLKAHAPQGVLSSLGFLLPLSPATSFVALCGIIAAEIVLGVAMIAGWRLRLIVPATTFTLVAFSGALALLAIDPQAPSCACLGAVRLSHDAQTSNLLGLARNGLLLAGCAYLHSIGGRGVSGLRV